MEDIFNRLWENLLGRMHGPLNFRLIVQPAVATFLAVRAGFMDARLGRPAFVWAALTNPSYRHVLIAESWKDVWKVFALAVALDAIYQLIVNRGVYLLELFIVATTLAVIPYILLRGPVARIAKRIGHKHAKSREASTWHERSIGN
ncbi:MAG TPA: hypothetical protein VJS37_17675 [Terriglobales bacterium]|jgi:hypothetical protein|nr:hypothetical protein [Terriglobales bacterium]